jgi:signal-transduction protein with cAMP-binding, CBS, and nucleotidyltransferase domain
MSKLREILGDRHMFYASPADSIREVTLKMSALSVGAILVLESGELRGLFSERDLMTRVVAPGRSPDTTKVGEVMSRDLTVINDGASIEDAMELMQRCKCRHLPVLRGSQVLGLVSMRDLMNIELERKTEEIQHMRAYIHGT